MPHEILNAKNHEREAQIIAKAGEKGAVTIATNMAGRGVDIILGGRAGESVIASPELVEGRSNPVDGGNNSGSPRPPQTRSPRDDENSWQARHDEVAALGGLHIMGTERHEARRIDDQLRGRAGRQGDPGSSQFFVSLEDDLMRIFAPERIGRLMEVLKMPEDQAIENKMISRAIESAQAKIEGFNFDLRKHVLEYDDVINKQRETIYRRRREILSADNLRAEALAMIEKEITQIVQFHTPDEYRDHWNLTEILEVLKTMLPLPLDVRQKMDEIETREGLIDYLIGLARQAYEAKEKHLGEGKMREIERIFYLRTMDLLWMEHLDEMDHLRDSVKLRAYGQKDPLVEYKNEGMQQFQRLLAAIQSNFVGSIYKVDLTPAPKVNHEIPSAVKENRPAGEMRAVKSIGRNDPCPCGSGKKYKRCHGQ